MADYQVTCVDKRQRDSPHESITHLGSRGWRWTQNAVVDSIAERTNTFYVMIAGRRADIDVVKGPNGDHVQSNLDGEWNDELLTLPQCSGYL
jgi:hypothetical protein